MSFECWFKCGKNWSYYGVINAPHSLAAAKCGQAVTNRKHWRILPEYSATKPYEYHFKTRKVAPYA